MITQYIVMVGVDYTVAESVGLVWQLLDDAVLHSSYEPCKP